MAMLKKLLGVRPFGTTMGHLVHNQVILPTFPRGLGLPLVVWLVAPCLLGILGFDWFCVYQRMISLVFFMWLHVKIDAFPFHLPLWDTHILLPQVVHFMSPLWKSYGVIIYSFVGFFNGLLTWAKKIHIFSVHSFECHVNVSSFLCRSNHRCWVIIPSYHTCISFVFDSFLYNVAYMP
jgi:hypothetical protein